MTSTPESVFATRSRSLTKGDELPPGVIKMVKVYVAIKRKLPSVTRWPVVTATRVSFPASCPKKTCRTSEDGTPVDVVLNPLGVPSRMNVGQILETHLGWAALQLGKQIEKVLQGHTYAADSCVSGSRRSTRPMQAHAKFIDGADELTSSAFPASWCAAFIGGNASVRRRQGSEIQEGAHHGQAVPDNGQSILFDGKTGEPFDHDVTVGVMYMHEAAPLGR
jgi:DNA-directed RNA polymerase subunit beta